MSIESTTEIVEPQVIEIEQPKAADEPKDEPTLEPAPEPELEPKLAKAKPDLSWRERELQRRVDKLTAQKRELEQKSAATTTDADVERRIEELAEAKAEARAQTLNAQSELNKAAEDAFKTGKEIYGESFEGKAKSIALLHDREDAEVSKKYVDFMSAIFETGESAKLINDLGSDLDEASRLMNLPPVKLGIALARLAAKNPTDVTKAPKPIIPLASKSALANVISASDPTKSDQLSTAAWMERRALEVAAANKKAGRRVL